MSTRGKVWRHEPRSKGLFDNSNSRLIRSFAEWDLLGAFQKRVMLRTMGIPPSLYKYRGIPPSSDSTGRRRLEDLLVENKLWLATASSFNDPFEGRVDYVVPYRGAQLRQAMEHKYRELGFKSGDARRMVKTADVADPSRIVERSRAASVRVLETIGICALGTNPSSPLLWAHYADNHRGLCAQLRPSHDLRALLANEVEYNDDYPVADDMFGSVEDRTLIPFLRKSLDWAYEEEWRIVAQDEPNTFRHFNPVAMSAVILGMRTSDADKTYILELMEERCRRFGVKPVVYQAEASQHKYRIVVRGLR